MNPNLFYSPGIASAIAEINKAVAAEGARAVEQMFVAATAPMRERLLKALEPTTPPLPFRRDGGR